jgi:predicted transposase YbfD/YdcC
MRAIAVVETENNPNGSACPDRSYYLSSMTRDAKLFANIVRCHWHALNRLH